MTVSTRNSKLAGYKLAARDLVSFRFDRSTHADRHWLLLGCMGVISVFMIAVAVIFGPGTYVTRVIAVPVTGISIIVAALLVIDYVHSLVNSPLWRR